MRIIASYGSPSGGKANRRFSISVINAEFVVRRGDPGALEIGTDEIIGGKGFFGAEVVVEEDSQIIDRFVVAIGSSPLR